MPNKLFVVVEDDNKELARFELDYDKETKAFHKYGRNEPDIIATVYLAKD